MQATIPMTAIKIIYLPKSAKAKLMTPSQTKKLSSNNIITNDTNTMSNNSPSSDSFNYYLLHGAFKKINKNKQGLKINNRTWERRPKFLQPIYQILPCWTHA